MYMYSEFLMLTSWSRDVSIPRVYSVFYSVPLVLDLVEYRSESLGGKWNDLH